MKNKTSYKQSKFNIFSQFDRTPGKFLERKAISLGKNKVKRINKKQKLQANIEPGT